MVALGLAVRLRGWTDAREVLAFLDRLEPGLGRRILGLFVAEAVLDVALLAGVLALWVELAPSGWAASPAHLGRPLPSAGLGLLVVAYAWPISRSAAAALSAGSALGELERAARAARRYARARGAAAWGLRLLDFLALGGPIGCAVSLGIERWGAPAAEHRIGREIARRTVAALRGGLILGESFPRAVFEGSWARLAALQLARSLLAVLPRLAAALLALAAARSPTPWALW